MPYLLLMIQNYTFQLLLCQKKIIKILLNNKIKVFKDLFIGTNIKQKKKNEDAANGIFKYINLDPSFKVLIDCLLWHILTEVIILIEIINENVIYQDLT